MPHQIGRPEARVDPRQAGGNNGTHEGDVGDSFEVLGDGPEIALARHPVQPVEARQVDGSAVTAEGELALEIEVVLEIRHRQFAQCPVDRVTGAQAGEVAGPDRAASAANTIAVATRVRSLQTA